MVSAGWGVQASFFVGSNTRLLEKINLTGMIWALMVVTGFFCGTLGSSPTITNWSPGKLGASFPVHSGMVAAVADPAISAILLPTMEG
jgi:hypothetical protein